MMARKEHATSRVGHHVQVLVVVRWRQQRHFQRSAPAVRYQYRQIQLVSDQNGETMLPELSNDGHIVANVIIQPRSDWFLVCIQRPSTRATNHVVVVSSGEPEEEAVGSIEAFGSETGAYAKADEEPTVSPTAHADFGA